MSRNNTWPERISELDNLYFHDLGWGRRTIFDCCKPKDIATQIFLFQLANFQPSEPYFIPALFKDKSISTVLWFSDVDEEQIQLFQIGEPACPEFEYIHPSEWRIEFLGTIEQFRLSKTFECLKKVPDISNDTPICVIRVRRFLKDFKGQDMASLFFISEIIANAEDGRLHRPKLYDWWKRS